MLKYKYPRALSCKHAFLKTAIRLEIAIMIFEIPVIFWEKRIF